ncbi:hypothetical protein F5878DRAFT_135213 [Lentinula raphanica]|uniref:Uncharacterized protein n=1 Tax=Lentinula raphanica TaxID=153919 RepID=A0AA38PAN7_9AGAR|nr:hypothetical protein F5878DRAFT_135213 [Lentinula raphanica]
MILPAPFCDFRCLFLLFATIPYVSCILQNITVSHTSSSITYKPNSSAWFSSDSSLDYSQSHTTTDTKGASASFTFTGVAIYYAAASWPYAVSANISLNGGAGTFVDLRDYNSAQSNGGSASASATVHWYRTGLKNTSHNVVVSLANNATYAVLDTLIYTIDDGEDSSDHTIWPIILGCVLGGLVLIGAIAGSVYAYRRRQKKNAQPIWDAPILENLMTPLVTTQSLAETHPLVSSEYDNSRHTFYPAPSPGIQSENRESSYATEPSELGRYSEYSRLSTSQQFMEGSSSSSSRSGLGSRTPTGAGYPNEKKTNRPDVVMNPETEELPPPAYSEHHQS